VIKNIAKSQGEKKIQKPGETRRKSKKSAPGTRRFFNQEKSLKTRSLLAKPGGLATLVVTAASFDYLFHAVGWRTLFFSPSISEISDQTGLVVILLL
jgi:hypothetical protein